MADIYLHLLEWSHKLKELTKILVVMGMDMVAEIFGFEDDMGAAIKDEFCSF